MNAELLTRHIFLLKAEPFHPKVFLIKQGQASICANSHLLFTGTTSE